MAITEQTLAAGYFLRRLNGKKYQWLLLKNRRRGDWGFPKGHAEPGESLRQTALRECAEETGIGLLAVDSATSYDLIYQLPGSKEIKRVAYFSAETRQKQVTISKEHSKYAWFDEEQVRERLIYTNLIALFDHHLRKDPRFS